MMKLIAIEIFSWLSRKRHGKFHDVYGGDGI